LKSGLVEHTYLGASVP